MSVGCGDAYVVVEAEVVTSGRELFESSYVIVSLLNEVGERDRVPKDVDLVLNHPIDGEAEDCNVSIVSSLHGTSDSNIRLSRLHSVVLTSLIMATYLEGGVFPVDGHL